MRQRIEHGDGAALKHQRKRYRSSNCLSNSSQRVVLYSGPHSAGIATERDDELWAITAVGSNTNAAIDKIARGVQIDSQHE